MFIITLVVHFVTVIYSCVNLFVSAVMDGTHFSSEQTHSVYDWTNTHSLSAYTSLPPSNGPTSLSYSPTDSTTGLQYATPNGTISVPYTPTNSTSTGSLPCTPTDSTSESLTYNFVLKNELDCWSATPSEWLHIKTDNDDLTYLTDVFCSTDVRLAQSPQSDSSTSEFLTRNTETRYE